MKLIVGLGNPGSKFEKTRHNMGRMFVSYLAKKHQLEFKEKKNLLSEITDLKIGDEKIILAKPTTFMNLSGQSTAKLKLFFKIDSADVIVIHDELDLPFGVVRIKQGGGSAGHHGVESVEEHIGNAFWRLRMGVGAEHQIRHENFVLSKFETEELKELKRIFNFTAMYLEKSLREGLSNTTLK